MATHFVSEPLIPGPGSANATEMSAGAPGVPSRFNWRDHTYHVRQVLSAWKESGPCTHGSQEQYVRKHWYDIRTTEGPAMRIYCDRRPSRGRSPRQRWWVFTIEEER